MATATACSVIATRAFAHRTVHNPGGFAAGRVPRRALSPSASRLAKRTRVSSSRRTIATHTTSDRDSNDGFLPNSFGTVGSAIELRSRLQELDLERREKRGGRDGDGWEPIGEAWVKLPRQRAWGAVHFVGGAVLGSYPHIAYDAFLTRLCDDAGVVVVATPYELGTDHGAISKECSVKYNAAWSAVCAREGYTFGQMPVFAAGHSLGCKLQLIAACISGSDDTENATDIQNANQKRAGHLFIAFNNATAADSVRLLEKFARAVLKKRAETASGGDKTMNDTFEGFTRNLPNLTALAEKAASAAGLDFTPSPAATMANAQKQFDSPKVRLVKFDKDDLDQNDALEVALRARYKTVVQGDAPVSSITLEGTHLSPVFFQFDGAGLSPGFAKLGGVKVGDEDQVAALAEDGVKFLMGR